MFLTCIYRSPGQNDEEFENFCVNFDLLLSNINDEIPICSIITGDFNALCSNWRENDIANSVGKELDSLTSSAGYSQIIEKPAHIANNSMSCIYLLFCTNTNVISKHGADVSFLQNVIAILFLVRLTFAYPSHQLKDLKIFRLVQKLNF